ncbi:molecular chaperone HtpG [Sporanaerobium hydrogeniformans]|uniref:Molecular chaperone HtpG n=1 Tax=Sporanaerobium hydrogeniformans TaxID=3072179 RepID=A0AC61DFW6_9FIRM|nr:molecular chaperone HtpG [Sporanaerobium hydrogeniformans]PHV71586.1 molecular chaperone HtpG [Sporanaerobium hydrogeniformans]
MSKQGNLSIHSENIFPIIKKWLYSDHDIFTRELISNACDAILKFKKLCDLGEATDTVGEPFKVTVTVNEKEKILVFEDNGIGMTEEEIEKYINQIAFSGAEDFLEKYKDKMDQDQIIGHFGLGFYSAFMVAGTITIDTVSYQTGTAVKWTCDGGTTYSISEGSRETRGTTITLHITEESKEFLNFYTLSQTIEKYCSFMPLPIYVVDACREETAKDEPTPEVNEEDNEVKAPEVVEPKPINDTHPLYTKQPNECSVEEYKEFYRKTFMDFHEPLFWIHLNMDYPFRLKGILYFPKLSHELETIEGRIKLYNNQVFVAENIKEVIPEFLLLLKGVIDCPDLPLNVSRSLLQNDGFVKKIADYITKKVADKLISLYKKENEDYKKFWDDIAPFIKYGCLRESKFYDKMKDYLLFKTTDDTYVTLSEYLETAKETHENKVFYVSNKDQQSQYITLFKENGLSAVYLEHSIDNPFISHMEMHNQGVKFMRIDADIAGALKGEEADKTHEEKLTGLFRKVLNNEQLKVSVENLKSQSVPSMILVSEESRRMQEMMKMYGMAGMGMPMGQNELTLVLNQNHPLIDSLAHKDLDEETTSLLCAHLYDLALLANQTLSPEAMHNFLERSNKLLGMIL